MLPGVAFGGLFALVPLDGVTLAGLGIGGVAELDEDGLALARALDQHGQRCQPIGDLAAAASPSK